jgi:hypothetical protein
MTGLDYPGPTGARQRIFSPNGGKKAEDEDGRNVSSGFILVALRFLLRARFAYFALSVLEPGSKR